MCDLRGYAALWAPRHRTVSGDDPEAVAHARGARRHAACCDAPDERVRLQHRDQHLELGRGVASGRRHVRHDRIKKRRQARVRGPAAGWELSARPALHKHQNVTVVCYS